MSTWPKQTPAAMNAYYGNPDANSDGAADAKWEAAHLVSIKPPYRMVLAWDTTKVVKTIRVNKACAESLSRVLEAIIDHYGSQAAVEKARMHLYGGCYNFRVKRGGSTLSIHSWGAAIDLDPERNAFGKVWRSGSGMMPKAVIDIFQAEGWEWGGLWAKADAMHFQAATTGAGPALVEEPKLPKMAPFPPTPHEEHQGGFPEKGARNNAQVVQVQTRLRELGYSEVGAIDGDFGDATEAAIMIFRRDNSLPLSGRIDNALLAALMTAKPRKVATDRAEAPPAVVHEQAPEVRASWQSKIWSQVFGWFSAVGAGITWLVSNFSDARNAVKPVADFLGSIPIWAYAALIGVGFFTVYFLSRKAEQKGVEAYREGARR